MNHYQTKISQVILPNIQRKNIFLKTFIPLMTFEYEKSFGRIFGLVEIESEEKKISQLVELIFQEFQANYYKPPENIKLQLEEKFESTLQRINLSFAAFLETESISLNLNKINILLGVIKDTELYFTQIGNINSILFHYYKKNDYRIINILESAGIVPSLPNPLKIFSQIISGRVKSLDTLFFCTPTILDYLSLEKIKNIICPFTEEKSTEELKKTLENLKSRLHFAALIIKLKPLPSHLIKPLPKKEFEYLKAISQDSMESLIKVEKMTKRFLTPSVIPEFKRYSQTLKKAIQKYLIKIKDTSLYKPIITKKIIKPRIKPEKFFIKGKNIIKSFTVFLKEVKINYLPKLKNYLLFQKVKNLLDQIIKTLALKFKKLPPKSRILLVFAIFLGLIFFQSIIFSSIRKYKEKNLENYNWIITEVKQKINEAESSLIYRDESKARELLLESQKLLKELKIKSKEKKEQIQLLNQEVETQLEKLRHKVEIPEPIMIANFQNLDLQTNIAPLILVQNNVLYSQNLRNKAIYSLNLESRLISAIYPTLIDIGKFQQGIFYSKDILLFFNDRKELIEFNVRENNFRSLNIEVDSQGEIKEMGIYNKKLYLLDSVNNQIYSYFKSSEGFLKKTPWLKEKYDLSQTISLAIDGDIYVLKTNGEILKFIKGYQKDFPLKNIDPPLKSPTKIKTLETSNYLYILDPPSQRIIVIDKNGNLISQYYSEAFSDLKDFVPNEEEKKIYVLAGSMIFGIPLSHLK